MTLTMEVFIAVEDISQTIIFISEIISCAKDVITEKENFSQLINILERIIPILKELINNSVSEPERLNCAVQILNQELKAAKQLLGECSKRSKVYLLLSCREIIKRLEDITRGIIQALDLLELASLNLSVSLIEEIGQLSEYMGSVEFKTDVEKENILEKIEMGIQERNVDRLYANNLFFLIADAIGISTERLALQKEYEEFKCDVENAQLRKDQAKAIQMDQIIALLERADAASSPKEKEMKYFSKRNFLGNQPLQPLQSFYCPITRDVMVDPVETSSGQTFERSAIEKWLRDGNKICPLTIMPLDTSILRPNRTLRQSIEEWKDRNTMITIGSMKPKFIVGDEEEVFHCLEQLQDLCEERDIHREWVVLENYIPILIKLLKVKNRELRIRALVILCILAKDSGDAKERISEHENAFDSIVHSLGRCIRERKVAVALLLELSKNDYAHDCIGMVQGCIFLLVTMSRSDDIQAAGDALSLLDNLSFSDHNVVQMAKANYFKHLLLRISTGSDEVKMTMAKTLSEMELTDQNKSSLFEKGALALLLQLLSHTDIEMKKISLKALQNLSSLKKNGLQMIREGAMIPLLDLLFCHNAQSLHLREEVASIVMLLALSTMHQEAEKIRVSFLESEDDVFRLFALMNLTGLGVQQSILRTFHAMCCSPSGTSIKTKLIQCSAVQVLVQYCEHDNLYLRANAVKLFSCLTEDNTDICASTLLEHVGQKCIATLIRIINSTTDEEEIAAAMCVVSNLPDIPNITRWLLDSDAVSVVLRYVRDSRRHTPHNNQVIENAVGAICRLTSPTNLEAQRTAAEAGIIPLLVQWLQTGTTTTKRRAAISLMQFSKSSQELSCQIPKRKGLWCFSAPPDTFCTVHKVICSVEATFCLLEADAIIPLVTVLSQPCLPACEASLDALLTLIEGEQLESGSKVLSDANAIRIIIWLLISNSPTIQEKSLNALERIFRQEEYKQKYGVSAQLPLVDITQRGTSRMRSMAARILGHLNILQDQSSYF